MRFSVWPGAAQPWPELLELASHTDDGFWHAIYVADHFMGNGSGPPYMLEATGVLAALAASTSRLRLANLVLSMTYRHPAVLANTAATIDQVSNGRLTLGLGAGWQVNEHEQYGIDLGAPRERVDRFAEGLAVLTGLLTQPVTSFDGRYYRLTDAVCEPKPVQSPLPVLIGAAGPRMLGLVARHAQQWNHWSAPGSFTETAALLDAACERVGRDPATVWRSTQALVIVTDTPEEESRARATADKVPMPVVHGSAARIADEMARWRDEGVDEIIIPDRAMPGGQQRLDAYDALAAALGPLA